MFKRILLVLIALLVIWVAYEWLTFPEVASLAREQPKTTAFIEQRKRQLRAAGKSDKIEWRWVSYGRIAPSMRRAVLVAEDNAFYEHEGVDVKAMREAWEGNLKRRRMTHGGSTITQQLAKNLYLSPSRNPVRKVREYLIARSLEKHLSKKRILEIYLNVVELGERVYGVEAGARHYFGKPASALTSAQAALLAGALPNPRAMSPAKPNQRLRARQAMILGRIKRWGFVAERAVLAEKSPEAPPDEKEDPQTEPATTEPTLTATPTETIEEPAIEPTITEPDPVKTETDPATTSTNTSTTQTNGGQ